MWRRRELTLVLEIKGRVGLLLTEPSDVALSEPSLVRLDTRHGCRRAMLQCFTLVQGAEMDLSKILNDDALLAARLCAEPRITVDERAHAGPIFSSARPRYDRGMIRHQLAQALDVAAVAALLVGASGASAHVLLEEPSRRSDEMKQGPCGRAGDEDGRTERFTRVAPGQTITVSWTETIDHVGSFVVGFDDDGADQADFDATILHQEADPPNPSGQRWQAEVTLPEVVCTNCTLQLLQIMTTDDTPAPSQIYYQCADLVVGDGESAPAEVSAGGCQATTTSPLLMPLLAVGLGSAARRRRRR